MVRPAPESSASLKVTHTPDELSSRDEEAKCGRATAWFGGSEKHKVNGSLPSLGGPAEPMNLISLHLRTHWPMISSLPALAIEEWSDDWLGGVIRWYGRVRYRIYFVCDTCVMVAAMVARAGRQGEINAAQVRYTRRTWVAGKACRGSLPEASAPLHLRLRSFPSAAWRCSFSQRRHSASRCPSCRSSTIRRCPRSSRFIGPDYGRCRRLPSSHSPGLPRYDAPIS